MEQANTIETQLENIIQTGYRILDSLQQEDPDISEVKDIFAERKEQLTKLNATEINKDQFDEKRYDQLRNLFTRLNLLEKSINNVFAKLSLQYRKSMKEVQLREKAQKSYRNPAQTSKFLDAQING